tara:strand:- start:228 stop:470 length:243 start_codon:yes stop_codon:yes gene_type:complete
MILAALKGLAALPRLIDAVESLGDVLTAQMAQKRKDEKDKGVDVLIAAARERRMSKREAERISGDSGEEPSGDGGRDFDG